MKKHLLQGVLLFSIIIVSSCSRRIVDFTIISSKNVPITNQGGNFQKATKRVKGIDSKWSILCIPGVPDMKDAIDNAIEQYPGAVALTDGVIYNTGWSCLLFGQNKYIVEGTPLFFDTEKQYLEKNNSQQLEIISTPITTLKDQFDIPLQNSAIRVEHIVEQDETMAEIASLYKITIPDILKWNKLSSIKIYKGMKLVIYIQ